GEVEAGGGGKLEVVEGGIGERMPLLRVVMAVGQDDPDRAVLVLHAEIEVGIGHQVKTHHLHRPDPSLTATLLQFRRKPCMACATAGGRSTWGRWPALGIMVSADPGISRWNASA